VRGVAGDRYPYRDSACGGLQSAYRTLSFAGSRAKARLKPGAD
jgi:hypothetical protein